MPRTPKLPAPPLPGPLREPPPRPGEENGAGLGEDLQQAGISVIGNFIFGLPDDDLKTMQQTLDLAIELNCEFANFYSAMAYPGSPLFRMAVDNGWALPETWSGFSQHSYDCLPLPTEKLSAAEVLGFRDEAFDRYFSTKRYLDMVTQKFGWDARTHIERMASHNLQRKILEPSNTPSEATESSVS